MKVQSTVIFTGCVESVQKNPERRNRTNWVFFFLFLLQVVILCRYILLNDHAVKKHPGRFFRYGKKQLDGRENGNFVHRLISLVHPFIKMSLCHSILRINCIFLQPFKYSVLLFPFFSRFFNIYIYLKKYHKSLYTNERKSKIIYKKPWFVI